MFSIGKLDGEGLQPPGALFLGLGFAARTGRRGRHRGLHEFEPGLTVAVDDDSAVRVRVTRAQLYVVNNACGRESRRPFISPPWAR